MFDRLLQNNTIVKIVAAGLAILLWLSVHSGEDVISLTGGGITQTVQVIRDKRVEVFYDTRNYSLVGEPKVNLTLRGSTLAVMNAVTNGDSIKVIANASGLGEGTHTIPVYPQGLPTGVYADEANVTITLESNVNKEVPVKLVLEGQPQEGLSVGEAMVTPKTLVVSGAKTAVGAVDRVVATLDIGNAAESIVTSVPVVAVDVNGKPVRNVLLGRERVEVNIPVTKPSKSVPLRLQFKGELPPGLAVESVDQSVSVTVFGNARTLATLDSYPAPVIDLSQIAKDTKLKLKLEPIEGITKVEPSEVEVAIKVVPAVQRTLTDIPLKVNGLREGQSFVLLHASDRVAITIEGAKELVDKLTPQDVSVFVDVTNQPAGRNEMRLQASTPNFIKLVNTQPASVTLDLKK
jgi:YbbR domain-containing protein